MERLALVALLRNFIRGCSERRADSETPAMMLGLTHRRLSWKEDPAVRLASGAGRTVGRAVPPGVVHPGDRIEQSPRPPPTLGLVVESLYSGTKDRDRSRRHP